MIPQLRTRSEYSFRTAYGPVKTIAAALAAMECPAAGLVDTSGTWGHVDWEKNLLEAGVEPLFGSEFVMADKATHGAPRYWAIAEDLVHFYRFSSRPPEDAAALATRQGVVVFAGAALTDPDTFDYIDINPRSKRRTRQAMALHKATGKPMVVTSDNDYPAPADRLRFLAWDDSQKMTPQHILTEEELRHELRWMPTAMLNKAIKNTHEVAERCTGQRTRQAPIISVDGDLEKMVRKGVARRVNAGHIKRWTPEHQARMDRELKLITEKEYDSYFIVVADMVMWAKERMLVGPARGSSAGSLVCYCLGITEVDPLEHDLIFERFIDLNRDDLPDIDIDFNDQKRFEVMDYLAEKYGRDNVARIGSINRLKPRSVIAHVGKKLGIPHGAAFGVTNVLIEYSSGDSRYGKGLEDTLNNTQPGKDFMAAYPEAALMGELEEHASHTGQHAAGVIVSNEPVTDYCTVRDGIAQVDKKGAEALNLLKIDILGLRTLGVLEDTGVLEPQEFYDLPLDDPKVFAVLNRHQYSGIFQFEGAAQRRVAAQLDVTEFMHIDHLTALARPGPLGGGAANTYLNRHAGREPVTYTHPSMAEYLSDTQGVVLYQEQVMRIVRELGKFSWEETSTIRKAMSGRKGKEFFDRRGEIFMKGAETVGMSPEEGAAVWESICNFGAWGMNKSHTVSYAVISYWCAWMKAYHPIKYAAACLRHAKDEEQALEILREMVSEGVPYTPFDPLLSEENWAAKDDQLVGGFTNLHGIGPVKAAAYIAKRNASGLEEKDLEKLAKHKPKHLDLAEGRTKWGWLYDDPSKHRVRGRIKLFGDLEDFEDACVICKLVRRERRDENETVRAAKRGYDLEGQTLFLDMFVVDDSITKPIVMRIKRDKWHTVAEPIADRAVNGQDWFLVRGKWLAQFSMMIVKRIRCLTNEELFNEKARTETLGHDEASVNAK